MIRRVSAAAALALVPVSLAAAVPAGSVEVRDEAGTVVTTTTGLDAIQNAVNAVGTSRAPETRPWSVVAGAGTYGDVAVRIPNVTVTADAGAAVVISGTGTSNDTGGGCIDVTRGEVTIAGLACQGPSRTGINVTRRNSEGTVVLRSSSVDRAGVDGVAVAGGRSIVLEGMTITSPARDGIRLTGLTTSGTHGITGGSVTGAGRDGLRLADDVRGLAVTGLSVTGSRANGIASEDAGNSDATFTGVTVTGSAGDGVLVGGGGLRIALLSSVVTGNAGAGVRLGDGSGLRVSGIPVDGSNRGGDLVFSSDLRTGGAYEGLRAPDGTFALAGEPNSARISGIPAARGASLAAGAPRGVVRRGAALVVAATARTTTRRVLLRFPVTSPARAGVYRRSGRWSRLGSSRRVRGGLQAILGTSQLGTAGTVYAPFG